MTSILPIFQSVADMQIAMHGQNIADTITTSYGSILASLPGRSPGTIKTYQANVLQFIRFVEANGINAHTYTAYRSELQTDLSSVSTKNAKLAAAASLLKECVRIGILPSDITGGTPGFKQSKAHKKTGLNPQDVQKVFNAINMEKRSKTREKLTAATYLMAYEGLRQAEVCSLTVEDVNTREGWVMVHGKGKTEKELFRITPQTACILEAYIKDKTGYLFSNTGGDKMTTRGMRKLFQKVFDIAGVSEKTLHGFRHFCITETLRATGGDLAKTRRRSRHSGFEMLVVYDDARQSEQDVLFLGAAFDQVLR